MKKIGVDIDEILSDTFSSIIKYYNKVHKTSIKKTEFISHNYWEIWGGTKQKAVKLDEEYFKTNYFRNIKPIKGAYGVLKELKKNKYEFFVITGRANEHKQQTIGWINKYYPDIFSDLFFANTFGKDGNYKKKSDICKSLGIKILIEDDPHYIDDCAKAGIKVIYLDYPWNKKVDLKNAFRVNSWKEIAKNIKRLSSEKI